MHCLYCGKPLGFLRELRDGEFCSGQHRERYKKLTKVALARLLEAQSEPALAQPVETLERVPNRAGPVAPLGGAAPLGALSPLGAFFGRPSHPELAAAVPVSAPEPLRQPNGPSLPDFAGASLGRALGNAASVWARLEPARPKVPLPSVEVSPVPGSISGASPHAVSLSGVMRQAATPAMRQAALLPSADILCQPRPSSSGRDDRCITPILECPAVAAMPTLPDAAAEFSPAWRNLFLVASLHGPPCPSLVPPLLNLSVGNRRSSGESLPAGIHGLLASRCSQAGHRRAGHGAWSTSQRFPDRRSPRTRGRPHWHQRGSLPGAACDPSRPVSHCAFAPLPLAPISRSHYCRRRWIRNSQGRRVPSLRSVDPSCPGWAWNGPPR